jgi:hypothetical protein
MEATPSGFKSNKGGLGLSIFDKKPLGEIFGSKDVFIVQVILINRK